MVHLAWNREDQVSKYFELFRGMVCSNGLFKKTPVLVTLILNVLGEYTAQKEIEHMRKISSHENSSKLAAKYIDLISQLPKIHDVSEENLQDIIPKNLECVFDLMKIYLALLSEVKAELGDSFPQESIEEFFTKILKPNLIQLYSETPTVFYKCLQAGDSNLKNKFFEICLIFCKIDSKFLLEVVEYLSSVYQKGDFSNSDTLMVDIRKDEFIGLKNLGCTCYANSMF